MWIPVTSHEIGMNKGEEFSEIDPEIMVSRRTWYEREQLPSAGFPYPIT
jgi:hypothetical protein